MDPNSPVIGYREPRPGVLMLQQADGKEVAISDPDGSRKARVEQIVKRNTSASTPKARGYIPPPPLSPEAQQPRTAPDIGAGAPPIDAGFSPPTVGGTAAVAAPAGAPPAPPAGPRGSDLVEIPGTPGGVSTQTSGSSQTSQSTRTEGLDPESRAAVEAAGERADAAQGTADEAAVAAQTAMASAQEDIQRARLLREAEAQREAEQREAEYQDAYESALRDQEEAQARPINAEVAFDGNRRWLALGATLAANIANVFNSRAGIATTPVTIVEDFIERTLAERRAQKGIDIESAGQRADVARQDMLAARGEMLTAGIRKLEALEKLKLAPAQIAVIEASKAELTAKRARANEDRAKAIASKQVSTSGSTSSFSSTSTTTPGTPARLGTRDQAVIEAAGGQEALTKWLDTKAGDGTIRETVNAYQQQASNIAFLKELARLNGGSIPTTGVIDLSRNETLRNLGARLGIEGSVDAEKAHSMLRQSVLAAARAMGGPTTESDIRASEEVQGKSTEAQLAYMQRMQEQRGRAVKNSAAERFGDRGQAVFDSYMGIASRATGPASGEGVEAF